MNPNSDPDDLSDITDWLLRQASEKARPKSGVESFDQFLRRVSPKWNWDWHYIKYLVGQLEEFHAGKFARMAVQLPPRHGKLIDHETPIWTRRGWRTHGDLVPGDEVIHPSGNYTRVVATSEEQVANRVVTFRDGSRIRCHANHEWAVRSNEPMIKGVFSTKAIQYQLERGIPYFLPSSALSRMRIQLVGVEKAPKAGPGRCIQVESPDGMYCVGRNMLPTHNSELHSIRFPVWCMTRDPEYRVCVGAYNQDYAKRVSRRSRTIARRAGLELSKERSAALEWQTTTGATFRACGVGNPPTGEGFDLIIIEDCFRSKKDADSQTYRDRVWDWATEDLIHRLEPGGKMLIPVTRYHVDDLLGRLQKSEDVASWNFIRVPAIAEDNDFLGRKEGEALNPDRYPIPALMERQKVMSPIGFAAIFQQRPVPKEGAHFKADWFKEFVTELDTHYLTDRTSILDDDLSNVLFVDPAMGKKGSDNTGLLVVSYAPKGRILVREAISRRIPIEELYLTIQRLVNQWGIEWAGVEANGFQAEVVREIRERCHLPVRELMPGSKEKLVRAQRAIVLAEQGYIFVPAAEPWVTPFITQLISFTGEGDEDDALVDCIAYCSIEQEKFTGGTDPVVWGGWQPPTHQLRWNGMMP